MRSSFIQLCGGIHGYQIVNVPHMHTQQMQPSDFKYIIRLIVGKRNRKDLDISMLTKERWPHKTFLNLFGLTIWLCSSNPTKTLNALKKEDTFDQVGCKNLPNVTLILNIWLYTNAHLPPLFPSLPFSLSDLDLSLMNHTTLAEFFGFMYYSTWTKELFLYPQDRFDLTWFS